MIRFLFLGLALAFGGCATPYAPSGYSGGYEVQRIALDRFHISFSGNGFTSDKRASDFAMLQAAETAIRYNFPYFEIWGTSDAGGVEQVYTGSTSTTYGNVSSYGNYSATTYTSPNVSSVYKPGRVLTIQCYEKPPSGAHNGPIFKAVDVRDKIAADYKIKLKG